MASLSLAATIPSDVPGVTGGNGRTIFSNALDGGALYVKDPTGTVTKIDNTFTVTGGCGCGPCGGSGVSGDPLDCAAVADCIDNSVTVQNSLANYLTTNNYPYLQFVATAPTIPWNDNHIEVLDNGPDAGTTYYSDGTSIYTNGPSAGSGGGIAYDTAPVTQGARVTFSVGTNADTISESEIIYDSINNTWNWNNVTQTGVTNFDENYEANYNNSTINYNSNFALISCSTQDVTPVSVAISTTPQATKATVQVIYDNESNVIGDSRDKTIEISPQSGVVFLSDQANGKSGVARIERDTVGGNITVDKDSGDGTMESIVCQYEGGVIINDNGSITNNNGTIENNTDSYSYNNNSYNYYDSNSEFVHEGDVSIENLEVNNLEVNNLLRYDTKKITLATANYNAEGGDYLIIESTGANAVVLPDPTVALKDTVISVTKGYVGGDNVRIIVNGGSDIIEEINDPELQISRKGTSVDLINDGLNRRVK